MNVGNSFSWPLDDSTDRPLAEFADGALDESLVCVAGAAPQSAHLPVLKLNVPPFSVSCVSAASDSEVLSFHVPEGATTCAEAGCGAVDLSCPAGDSAVLVCASARSGAVATVGDASRWRAKFAPLDERSQEFLTCLVCCVRGQSGELVVVAGTSHGRASARVLDVHASRPTSSNPNDDLLILPEATTGSSEERGGETGGWLSAIGSLFFSQAAGRSSSSPTASPRKLRADAPFLRAADVGQSNVALLARDSVTLWNLLTNQCQTVPLLTSLAAQWFPDAESLDLVDMSSLSGQRLVILVRVGLGQTGFSFSLCQCEVRPASLSIVDVCPLPPMAKQSPFDQPRLSRANRSGFAPATVLVSCGGHDLYDQTGEPVCHSPVAPLSVFALAPTATTRSDAMDSSSSHQHIHRHQQLSFLLAHEHGFCVATEPPAHLTSPTHDRRPPLPASQRDEDQPLPKRAKSDEGEANDSYAAAIPAAAAAAAPPLLSLLPDPSHDAVAFLVSLASQFAASTGIQQPSSPPSAFLAQLNRCKAALDARGSGVSADSAFGGAVLAASKLILDADQTASAFPMVYSAGDTAQQHHRQRSSLENAVSLHLVKAEAGADEEAFFAQYYPVYVDAHPDAASPTQTSSPATTPSFKRRFAFAPASSTDGASVDNDDDGRSASSSVLIGNTLATKLTRHAALRRLLAEGQAQALVPLPDSVLNRLESDGVAVAVAAALCLRERGGGATQSTTPLRSGALSRAMSQVNEQVLATGDCEPPPYFATVADTFYSHVSACVQLPAALRFTSPAYAGSGRRGDDQPSVARDAAWIRDANYALLAMLSVIPSRDARSAAVRLACTAELPGYVDDLLDWLTYHARSLAQIEDRTTLWTQAAQLAGEQLRLTRRPPSSADTGGDRETALWCRARLEPFRLRCPRACALLAARHGDADTLAAATAPAARGPAVERFGAPFARATARLLVEQPARHHELLSLPHDHPAFAQAVAQATAPHPSLACAWALAGGHWSTAADSGLAVARDEQLYAGRQRTALSLAKLASLVDPDAGSEGGRRRLAEIDARLRLLLVQEQLVMSQPAAATQPVSPAGPRALIQGLVARGDVAGLYEALFVAEDAMAAHNSGGGGIPDALLAELEDATTALWTAAIDREPWAEWAAGFESGQLNESALTDAMLDCQLSKLATVAADHPFCRLTAARWTAATARISQDNTGNTPILRMLATGKELFVQ